MHHGGEAHNDGRLDPGGPQEISTGEVADIVGDLRVERE